MPSGERVHRPVDKRLMFKESGNKADNGLLSKYRKLRAYLMERGEESSRPGRDRKDKTRKQRLTLANTIGHKVSQ